MPTDIIEMFWGCTVCNAENKGRFKTCQSCGAPRTEDSPEWMPDDISPMAAVKDPTLLKKFKGGADWKCKYCDSSQFRADGYCAQCGSPQTDSTAEKPAKKAPATTPPPTIVDKSYHKSERVKYGAIAGTIIAVLVISMFLLFRTKIVDIKVSAVAWTYTVKVDRYQVWKREGWDPDPSAFNTHDEGRRVHHYEHVRVGSHIENYTVQVACGQDCRTIKGSCYTTPRSCTSNKNGSATCTGGDRVCSPDTQSCTTRYCSEPRTRTVDDYEDQPRYRTWYSWNVWDWGFNRNVVTNGNTIETHWPSPEQIHLGVGLAPQEKEREAGRTEKYNVTFSAKKDTYQYEPKSLTDSQRFGLGSAHRIKVGVAHGVEVLPNEK